MPIPPYRYDRTHMHIHIYMLRLQAYIYRPVRTTILCFIAVKYMHLWIEELIMSQLREHFLKKV